MAGLCLLYSSVSLASDCRRGRWRLMERTCICIRWSLRVDWINQKERPAVARTLSKSTTVSSVINGFVFKTDAI